MFKEVKISACLTILLGYMACSCGSSTNNKEIQDSIRADEFLECANEAYNNGNPQEAMLYIDSIDSVCVEQVSARRKAMKLKPYIKEALIMKEIQTTDSLLTIYEINKASANDIYKAQLKKEKLERQLQVARNQIARLTDDINQ